LGSHLHGQLRPPGQFFGTVNAWSAKNAIIHKDDWQTYRLKATTGNLLRFECLDESIPKNSFPLPIHHFIMPIAMITYHAYGLNIRSEIPLPDLPMVIAEPEVDIHLSVVSRPHEKTAAKDYEFTQVADGILLDWHEFGRFLLRNGNEILVELEDGADETFIRHLIMGPVLCLLNYQRGVHIFHASAIAHPTGAIAFMAGLGYGKSTQAAAFIHRGYPLITDDVLLLTSSDRKLMAIPGVPFLKLWPETLITLGENPDDFSPVKTNLPKRTYNREEQAQKELVALRAAFILDQGDELKIERLSPLDALRWILPNWYGVLFHGELLPILGLDRQFHDCTKLVQSVPVFRLQRPPSLDLLPQICDLIECNLSAIA
jgi:hypothetical protein